MRIACGKCDLQLTHSLSRNAMLSTLLQLGSIGIASPASIGTIFIVAEQINNVKVGTLAYYLKPGISNDHINVGGLSEPQEFVRFASRHVEQGADVSSVEELVNQRRQNSEYAEAVADVRQGILDEAACKSQPLTDAFAELRNKLGIADSSAIRPAT